ncbi:YrdB family protein [Mucilaginibacter sp. BJC16-A38]|uniref:YrdB family protein n=1 Tax=Mucilaginibacter phenanthrenivorans TaxID=1234842 RepID=UPI002157DB4A|nr:YrdB family protein [Mucilaginibacter phenanthrenivorans]MCR8558679.1 YrdB family protein [Mucilaginibacter phenanthrenivorans]
MNTNPINLAVRFLLEITMLIALGYWGWHATTGWLQYLSAIGLPAIAATLWGVFRIQNDPKPAPVEVPGVVRLLLEWALFGAAVLALFSLGYFKLSLAMAIVVKLHYIVSYDRTWAMLRNKAYEGFLK